MKPEMKNRDDVRWWFDLLLSKGISFHPDTRGDDYVPPLQDAADYDAHMERCFELGREQGFDVYEVASEAWVVRTNRLRREAGLPEIVDDEPAPSGSVRLPCGHGTAELDAPSHSIQHCPACHRRWRVTTSVSGLSDWRDA